MKRKLLTLATLAIIGLGHCGAPCFDPRPDYCGIQGKTATVVMVNGQARIIGGK